jgi:hypothetical protein
VAVETTPGVEVRHGAWSREEEGRCPLYPRERERDPCLRHDENTGRWGDRTGKAPRDAGTAGGPAHTERVAPWVRLPLWGQGTGRGRRSLASHATTMVASASDSVGAHAGVVGAAGVLRVPVNRHITAICSKTLNCAIKTLDTKVVSEILLYKICQGRHVVWWKVWLGTRDEVQNFHGAKHYLFGL